MLHQQKLQNIPKLKKNVLSLSIVYNSHIEVFSEALHIKNCKMETKNILKVKS